MDTRVDEKQLAHECEESRREPRFVDGFVSGECGQKFIGNLLLAMQVFKRTKGVMR